MTITPRSPAALGALRCIATAAAFEISTVPTKLISIILRKNAPAIAPCLPTKRAGMPMPAQLTAASIEPICSRARSIAPLTADSSVTSVAMKAARSPSAAAAAVPWASFTSRSVTFPPASAIRFATARPSPEAPPVTTACDSFSCMGLFSSGTRSSFKTDGGVHAGRDAAVVEPARRHGFGLRVELHHLLAVGAEIAEFGAARSGKAEDRHGHRNRNVDPHLAHVDLALKFAGDGAALREDAGAVAEGIVVDERDRLVQRIDADDDHHGSENLGGVDFHLSRHSGENRRADEVALLVARHFDGTAVQLELGAFLDAVFHQPENAVFRVLRNDWPEIGAFFHAGVDLERLRLGDDIRYPFPC